MTEADDVTATRRRDLPEPGVAGVPPALSPAANSANSANRGVPDPDVPTIGEAVAAYHAAHDVLDAVDATDVHFEQDFVDAAIDTHAIAADNLIKARAVTMADLRAKAGALRRLMMWEANPHIDDQFTDHAARHDLMTDSLVGDLLNEPLD